MTYTYLCHSHYMNLPGYKETWTTSMMGIEKCIVCGDEAEHELSNVCLRDGELARFIVLYFEEFRRKYVITQEEIDECTNAWIHENDCEHLCGQCHFPLTLVRPGKYQCETLWCPSQQEETK